MPKINVEVAADSSALVKAFARARSSAKGFERDVGKAGRGAAVGSGVFHGLGRSVAFASASFLGGAGLGFALKATVSAATQAQVAQAQLRTQLKASGISYKAHRGEISKTIEKQGELSGFLNDDLTKSFVGFVRRTGNVNQALRLNAVATDIARAKGKDLTSVQQQLVRALAGNARAATSLGLPIVSVTKNYDALKNSGKKATAEQIRQAKAADKLATGQAVIALAQKRYGGQAEAFGKTSAGAQERFRRALHETEITIGNALLPSLTKLFRSITDYLNKLNRTGKLQRIAAQTARVLGTAFHVGTTLLRAFVSVVRIADKVTGSLKNSVIALTAAFVAFKAVRVGPSVASSIAGFALGSKKLLGTAKAFTSLARSEGIVGTLSAAFPKATTRAILLRKALVGKAGIAGAAIAAGVGLSLLIRKFPGFDKAAKRLGGHFFDLAAKIGLVNDPTKKFSTLSPNLKQFQQLRREAARLEAHGLTQQQAAARLLAKHPGLDKRDLQVLTGGLGTKPHLPGEQTDSLSRFVANAATDVKKTKKVVADVVKKAVPTLTAAQKAALVQKRNDLFDSILDARLGRIQRLPLSGQLVALRKISAQLSKRISVTKDITRKLKLEGELFDVRAQRKDVQKQIAQNLIDKRTARQFRELGLTATGDAITPGVASLKKRLGSVSKAIQGTFLDTGKTKSVLARIRKVLSEGLVPKDVRAKLKEMLDSLTDELKNHAQKNQTKFRHANISAVLAGLGLSPDAFRKAEQRLAQLGAGNTLPGQGSAAFAGAGAQTLTVNTNVNLDGKTVAKNTTAHQRKINKRRTPARRGPYAGHS